jgi:hypothetical protein
VTNMASLPTLAPLQNEAIAIHKRLLARDPTASDDLAGAYLEPLVVWLRETDRRAPEDTRVEAAEDAILALIRRPESYSPGRQTLEVYLRMSARGDLVCTSAGEVGINKYLRGPPCLRFDAV